MERRENAEVKLKENKKIAKEEDMKKKKIIKRGKRKR